MFGRSPAEVPGAGRTARLPAVGQQLAVPMALPSFPKAGTVSFPPLGWHLLLCLAACCQPPSCQSLLAGRALGPQSHCFSQPLSVSFNPLAAAPQLYCSVFHSPHTRCPGSGVQTPWPRWSLTNLLSLCSEYLQCSCWSIPKQILYITGINQVKYQLFPCTNKKLKKNAICFPASVLADGDPPSQAASGGGKWLGKEGLGAVWSWLGVFQGHRCPWCSGVPVAGGSSTGRGTLPGREAAPGTAHPGFAVLYYK